MKKAKIAIVVACALWSLSGSVFAVGDDAWNYNLKSNQGPAHWGDNYPACQSGGFQSPINIRPGDVSGKDATPIRLEFQPLKGHLADDGHSVVLNPSSFVKVGASFYLPLQFHFHSLAETQLNGHRSAAEIHFVAQNSAGQYLVLAVRVEPGKSNKMLARVLRNTKQDEMFFSKQEVESFFPQDLSYYKFEGSLTNPPCSRGITWVVFADTITASQAQIRQLQEEFQNGADNYYRPIQKSNHRPILVGRVLT